MATDGGKRAERPASPAPRQTARRQTRPEAKQQPTAKRGRRRQATREHAARATGARTRRPDRQRPPHRRRRRARLPYEQARDQLTELVKRLEAGGLTLEQSLELWERGERLAAICEDWLEGARARLAAAMAQRSDNEPAPGTPF